MALANPALGGQGAAEYEVKAAFLYKFASFVEWPSRSGGAPVCIGVVGQDPFGTALDQVVNGKSVDGRAFVIRRFKSGQELKDCDIVFISSTERGNLRPILAALAASPVLTVGDMPGFCERGGVVNLELLDRRIHLQVNLEAANQARLQLSSKLLSLATIVRARNQ